ncbi:DUF4190 domain-containing protein [Nocardioides pelophilus]|uniref:DUF4190 domain-containing protein n=1 Tax=Nocardioides pelophilus TaxID=2172019 RepID=UPI001601860F|nr:DUF4190 domain-containing protein [Nocardioides pelophilus]
MGEHPKGQTILILGILSLVCCGFWTGVPAIIMGNKAMAEIAAGQYAETSGVKIGRLLGIIGTVLSALGAVFYILFFVLLASS